MKRPIAQLGLPGLEHHARDVPVDDPPQATAEASPPPAPEARPTAPEGQLDLFDDFGLLRHDLESALARADFEAARALRERLADTYGRAATRPYRFLDELDDLWERPAHEALEVWAYAEDDIDPEPLRRRARQAVLTRLIDLHGAAFLVARAPRALPDVVAALVAGDDEPAGFALVRDALLAGRNLEPLAFDAPALRDLLAEDLPPRWLACLGAIRRLWPVPTVDRATPDAPDEEDDDARADAFWRALGVAQSPAASDAERQEARRRLKCLHPGLHAQHLGRRAG
jgi:hypothetical protein